MSVTKDTIGRLFEESPFPIEISYWDGDTRKHGKGEPGHRLTFNSARAARRLIFGLSLGFGEGYMDGDIEIEGDLQELLALPCHTDFSNPILKFFDTLSEVITSLRNKNTISGSRKNISHHYDIGNDFYRLWLDRNLQYTCSYFTDPEQDLDSSQEEKMDYICQKVGLKEGDVVLETGYGWGGLAVYAAKKYGVNVTAYNISREQILYARRLAEEFEVNDLVTFVCNDYRNASGKYDKFLSIGMIEHVGKEHYRTFADVVNKRLKGGGSGLVHFIGKVTPRRTDPWIDRYIFPGAYIPALSEVLATFEERGLLVRDVENLRLHYARTLDLWADRFEKQIDKVRETFDERFIRMWRLYLNASSVSFKYGGQVLYQVLLTNGLDNHEELTREPFYTPISEPPRWNYTM